MCLRIMRTDDGQFVPGPSECQHVTDGGWHTRTDYLHLTKRLGSIALSQFLFQCPLSLKSAWPRTLPLQSSHEFLNRFHRMLGGVGYLLLTLHAVFYLNCYLQIYRLDRFTSTVVILGIICAIPLRTLMYTSLAVLKTYSYRVFLIINLIIALGELVLVARHRKGLMTGMLHSMPCRRRSANKGHGYQAIDRRTVRQSHC